MMSTKQPRKRQEKAAEEALANQGGELDYGRASAQLAEAAAQLATLRKLKKSRWTQLMGAGWGESRQRAAFLCLLARFGH